MYQTFSEYREARELFDFNSKVICLYEGIIRSGMSVDEWWEKHGMPVVLEDAYSNEEELLMELMGQVGNWIGQQGRNALRGAANFGRGLASGWQNPTTQIWQPNGMNPNIQPNTDPNAPYAQPTSQNPYPQRNAINPQDILQTHQQMMQKLKDLQAHYVQNKDNRSYAAIQNLMKQMNQLPNMVRSMG